ncbi:MAG: phosphomannomutase [Pseudomonadota bacterium]
MPEFGTSGLRGQASALTDDLCAAYAGAFVSLHAPDGRVFIGRDRRESSPRIAAAVAAGIAGQGAEAIDCGVLPTPALAHAALAEGAAAIMVTGSHIPADRNGLKFYTPAGEFTKADETALRDAVAGWTPRLAAPDPRSQDALGAYISRYTGGLPGDTLTGMRLGVWLQSSAAAVALPAILSGLGAEVVPLGPSETFIPVDTEAIDAAARAQLAEWVAAQGLDALVSTDGDADRPLMVDDAGQVVPGDILGPITARWCGAGQVVTTVSANSMVDRMETFKVTRTRIGSPYVIAGMAGRERVAGYEPNGGFLLGWDMPRLPKLMTRDAALPLIAPLIAARERGLALSALIDSLPRRRTATDRLQNVPREVSEAIVAALLAGDHAVLPPGLGPLLSIDQTDGVRMSFGSGRIVHIRPSGNAPELRCYVEAESAAHARNTLDETLSRLKRAVP